MGAFHIFANSATDGMYAVPTMPFADVGTRYIASAEGLCFRAPGRANVHPYTLSRLRDALLN